MKEKISDEGHKKNSSYDWLDFQKVEGYDSSKHLLFQIFDLYPKVRELRGQKEELKNILDEAKRKKGKEMYQKSKQENDLGLSRLQDALKKLGQNLKKLRESLELLAGKLKGGIS